LTQSLVDEYVLGMNPRPVVHVKLPPESIEVEVDVERIGQVIINLLSNARKYSSVGTPIHVTLERNADDVCISVRDSGVGIPADVLPQIFERFYRVPGTEVLTGSSIGFGLGLYISKQIVERHGGQIEVESIPHEGSLFIIRLPIYAEQTVTHLDAEPTSNKS
jgi:signal transduction histidine kinase